MNVVKRRNRQLTMNRIIQASAEVIAAQGVDKAGINAIANQAKVNKVLIYRYFGGWNGLVEALYAHILSRITNSATDQASIGCKNYLIQFYHELQINVAWQTLLSWQMANKGTEVSRRLAALQEESFVKLDLPQSTLQIIQFITGGIIHAVLSQQHTDAIEVVIPSLCSHILSDHVS